MLITVFFLLAGFIILGLGAELLIRGSSTIAFRLGISPLIIGLTVVAFGTSAPELTVSIQSAITGHNSIALGNVIGSNIANIGLILGAIAILMPFDIEQQLVRKQIPLLIAASVFLWLLLLDGELSLIDSIFLLSGLIGFLFFSYQQSRLSPDPLVLNVLPAAAGRPTGFYAVMLVVGLAMLIYGSSLFVEAAVDLARLLGVSEAVIGLSIVAIGTSIPELAASLFAVVKKESSMAVGNVVGSNLFNILGILGITGLIHPIESNSFSSIDFGVMLAYALILLLFSMSGLRISRNEGLGLLAGYIAYMVYIFLKS
jgi:cation:H+ antiporter